MIPSSLTLAVECDAECPCHTFQADRTDAEVAELRERLARLEGSTS